MTEAVPTLGFTLHLSRQGGTPRVERRGPTHITQVGLGRTLAELTQLAALIFPICARAQAAAALSAGEHAIGIELSSVQRAARNAIILAESVSACIWRCALTWPSLLGAPGQPDLVRSARQASDDLVSAIFEGDWQRPGGATVRLEPNAVREALQTLEGTIRRLEGSIDTFLVEARRPVSVTCDPVGEALMSYESFPTDETKEESPRALLASTARSACQSDWFAAQWQHTLNLFDELRANVVRLDNENAPAIEKNGDGIGMGIAMTARGRLRHVVEVRAGKVVKWEVAAPTDWNLAAGGLLTQLATNLGSDDGTIERAKWAVAAVDPCAPCPVEWVEEKAHA